MKYTLQLLLIFIISIIQTFCYSQQFHNFSKITSNELFLNGEVKCITEYEIDNSLNKRQKNYTKKFNNNGNLILNKEFTIGTLDSLNTFDSLYKTSNKDEYVFISFIPNYLTTESFVLMNKIFDIKRVYRERKYLDSTNKTTIARDTMFYKIDSTNNQLIETKLFNNQTKTFHYHLTKPISKIKRDTIYQKTENQNQLIVIKEYQQSDSFDSLWFDKNNNLVKHKFVEIPMPETSAWCCDSLQQKYHLVNSINSIYYNNISETSISYDSKWNWIKIIHFTNKRKIREYIREIEYY